jgi:predicted amidohydrolase YtcJ
MLSALEDPSMKMIVSIVSVVLGLAAPAVAQGRCAQARDLRLVNGRIHTLDARNTIVTEVTVKDGKFTAVGRGEGNLDPCTRTIDLGGRTVVPGLIDNHNHIVLLGMRPGHDVRLETAASIADVQAMLRARAATVPRGEFITTLGDWNAKQFAEKRAPTLAELDAALPQHPYIMNGSGTVVNTLA